MNLIVFKDWYYWRDCSFNLTGIILSHNSCSENLNIINIIVFNVYL